MPIFDRQQRVLSQSGWASGGPFLQRRIFRTCQAALSHRQIVPCTQKRHRIASSYRHTNAQSARKVYCIEGHRRRVDILIGARVDTPDIIGYLCGRPGCRTPQGEANADHANARLRQARHSPSTPSRRRGRRRRTPRGRRAQITRSAATSAGMTRRRRNRW